MVYLKVWQKAIDLVVETYRVTKLFPPDELYGLVSQMRRAAVSIPLNVAEGHGRRYRGDYLRHLTVANGSLTELETAIEIALRLCYITQAQATSLMGQTSEIGRMLVVLTKKLQCGARTRGRVQESVPAPVPCSLFPVPCPMSADPRPPTPDPLS